MERNGRLNSVAKFYAMAVMFSWIAWSPLVLSRTGLGILPFTVPMPWTIAGTLGPPLAAWMMLRREPGAARPVLIQLSRPRRRSIIGGIAGSLIVALTFVLGTSTIVSVDPPRGWQIEAISLYGFHAVATLLGGPIFEEWGWRGFAQPRLQAEIGPTPAALLVGLAWSLWHLPLFLLPAWSSASPTVYLAMVTSLSVVIAWGFNLSGGWIFAAIAMHFTYNASSRVLGGFLGEAHVKPWPDPVTAIMLAFVIVSLVLIALTSSNLGYRSSKAPSR